MGSAVSRARDIAASEGDGDGNLKREGEGKVKGGEVEEENENFEEKLYWFVVPFLGISLSPKNGLARVHAFVSM